MQSATYAFDSTWRPLLRDLGVSAEGVLRRAGLPDNLLSRSSVRLPVGDFHRFWLALEAEYGDPLLPVRLCQMVRSEGFSPALFAALCSPNLLVATQRVARFKPLVAPIRLDLHTGRAGYAVRFVWRDDLLPPPDSLVITELLFLVTLARMGTRESVQPVRVVTSAVCEPMTAAHCADYLGVSMRPGRTHEVLFRPEDAQRPFLTVNDGMWAAFEPHLRLRLAELDVSVSVHARVRAVLLEALPAGVSDIEEAARRLAMSPRSLQRQLAAEGTTFRSMLRETRLSLAEHYLRDTLIPPAEIALLLGFEEANSFHRAYRGWTGRTPERVRRETRRIPPP